MISGDNLIGNVGTFLPEAATLEAAIVDDSVKNKWPTRRSEAMRPNVRKKWKNFNFSTVEYFE